MRGEPRWAVIDGPEGTHAVELPGDVTGARRLVTQARGRFWCATRAGGCGEKLVAGAHGFRHARTPTSCRLSLVDGGPAYQHLRYEPALTAWLNDQGFEPRSRAVRTPDGVVHLQLIVPQVDGVLEVQLSPLPDAEWRVRDDAGRAGHRAVTWFYGPDATDAAATEAAVRGAALQLRRQGRGLVVGVRDAEGGVRWVPLSASRLTGGGVTAPGLAEARADHSRHAAARQEAARLIGRPALLSPIPRLDQLPFPV